MTLTVPGIRLSSASVPPSFVALLRVAERACLILRAHVHACGLLGWPVAQHTDYAELVDVFGQVRAVAAKLIESHETVSATAHRRRRPLAPPVDQWLQGALAPLAASSAAELQAAIAAGCNCRWLQLLLATYAHRCC